MTKPATKEGVIDIQREPDFSEEILIKPQPDEDFYVCYSTVLFGPTEWGTRAESEELFSPKDFENADKFGSSSTHDSAFHWADRRIEVRDGWAEGLAPDSAVTATIDREHLRELCESDVGAGFTTRPQSIKWFHAPERVALPKSEALIPKKGARGSGLWFPTLWAGFWLFALALCQVSFPGLSELFDPRDWGKRNGGWLSATCFTLLLSLTGIGGAIFEIRDRRTRERKKLVWLEARSSIRRRQ